MQLVFNIGDELKLGEGTTGVQAKSITSLGTTLYPIFWVIIKNIYILTGIILFFMMVVGGVGMIANAGNAEKQKQSSQTITSAVFGYLIMFAAFWIVRLIEVITGKTIFLTTWFSKSLAVLPTR